VTGAPGAPGALGTIRSFALSPDGSQLLLIAHASGRQQPWLVPVSDWSSPRLFPVDGSASRAAWHPGGGRFVVQFDPDGREDHQLAEIDIATGTVHEIAAQPGTRNELGLHYSAAARPYSPDGRYLAYATNRRKPGCFDIVLRDTATGQEQTILTAGETDALPEDRYFPVAFSWDSRQLIVTRVHQLTEHDLYAVDIGTARKAAGKAGRKTLLTPHEGPAKYFPAAARPEGIYLTATHDGNFTGLALLTPDGRLTWIDTPDHDVELAALSADGSRLAWAVNEDGYTTIRHCEIRDGKAQEHRQLTSLPRGVYVYEYGLRGHALHLSADGAQLFVLGETPWSVNLSHDTARELRPAPATRRPDPEVVGFTSSDGTPVTALLHRPSGDGPFPVVVDIHGGPESQARPAADELTRNLTQEGIAVLQPNFRGSSGYGLRYQRLIYRDWGGGDLEDLRAAAEFLRAQPWVNRDRIAVYGASYGGFAAQCCLTRLPEYWCAGVSECGVSDLVQDLRVTDLYWQRRAPDLIGDISDPDDVKRLTEASPLTHADQLRVPLLLIHGANDTNVNVESSDLLYARLTELGRPVRYVRVDDAGHAISQKIDTASLIRDWLAEKLLGAGASQ
jgi:dipeptidyl aminopeptidase/acylaminoacyl peptidase